MVSVNSSSEFFTFSECKIEKAAYIFIKAKAVQTNTDIIQVILLDLAQRHQEVVFLVLICVWYLP